jgi:hypothetical protein
MTERDRSAERRVAEFISQNMPASVKKPEQESDDLFTAAEKQRSRLPDHFLESPPVAGDSATSRAAANTIASTRRPKAFLVYYHIKSLGKHGATRQELVDALGISLQTICSLVRRLYEMGLIGSNPGHVRLNRFSGMENEVMLYEDHVTRWQPDQSRPPIIPKWMAKQ